MRPWKSRVSVASAGTGPAVIGALLSLSMLARADEHAAPATSEALRDHAVDIVQADESRIYHLEGTAGLLVYDVSRPDRPRLAGRHEIVGWPLGVVVRDEVATIVMRWSDVRSGGGSMPGPASVRAIDLRDAAHPRVMGKSTIEGVVHDARVTDSALFVLSESRTPSAVQTIVTAVRLDGSNTSAPHAIRRDGSAGALRIVGERIVLATIDPARPGTRLEVLGDDATSGLTVRGSVDLKATMGREDRDVSERLDAADPAHVRVLGCRKVPCAAGDTLEVTTIDATDATSPRVVSRREVQSPGPWLVTRFDGRRLYVSRRGWLGLGAPSTPVSIVDLDAPLLDAQVQIPRAVIWNLIPHGSRLFVVGTRGDADVTREEVVVDAIGTPAGHGPSLDAEIVLGGTWISSPAEASSEALSVCGNLLAVPFRSWQAGTGAPRSAVALFYRSEQSFEPSSEVAVPGTVERLACVHGRLFAVGDAGVWSIDAVARVTRGIAPAALAEGRRVDSP